MARKPGWFRVANEILDTHGPQLGPYGLAVYCALCRHADKDGKCFPSYQTLAMETGMGRSTAIKAVTRLEGLNLIRVVPQIRTTVTGRNRDTSNIYYVLALVPPTPAPQP